MRKTYYATLELDPRSGQWMADVEGLPVHTWGRSLPNVKQYAHEALAVHLDVEVSEVQGRLKFRTPQLPSAIKDAVEQALTARSDADLAARKATKARADAARALVRDGHLSLRDAAEVLGVSHQRIQQLLAS
jgi:predicted RNase H-like HicB family nuclease